MIRVLVCDDQDVVRQGLQIILTHTDGVEVVGLAEHGEMAVQMAMELKPDVICMDLMMPRMNGVDATRVIMANRPETKIVILTTYATDEWVINAIRAGAVGYLLKDADSEQIVDAIRGAMDGKGHVDPSVTDTVFRAISTNTAVPQTLPELEEQDPLYETLTERELSILQLMCDGKTNKEIASALFLAEGTVKNQVSNLIGKLQVNDRTQAVLSAIRRGLVQL